MRYAPRCLWFPKRGRDYPKRVDAADRTVRCRKLWSVWYIDYASGVISFGCVWTGRRQTAAARHCDRGFSCQAYGQWKGAVWGTRAKADGDLFIYEEYISAGGNWARAAGDVGVGDWLWDRGSEKGCLQTAF